MVDFDIECIALGQMFGSYALYDWIPPDGIRRGYIAVSRKCTLAHRYSSACSCSSSSVVGRICACAGSVIVVGIVVVVVAVWTIEIIVGKEGGGVGSVTLHVFRILNMALTDGQ